MNVEFNTLELARVYESQGHFQEALGIYQSLADQGRANDPEIEAALERMKSVNEKHPAPLETTQQSSMDPEPSPGLANDPEKKIEDLLAQWLMLMVLEKRLGLFQKIKTRL